MNTIARSLPYVAVVSVWLAVAMPAHAYIGPGAGLGAIGTLIAFVGAVLFAIVGFVWYPVKRLLRKKQRAATPAAPAANGQTPPGKGETLPR